MSNPKVSWPFLRTILGGIVADGREKVMVQGSTEVRVEQSPDWAAKDIPEKVRETLSTDKRECRDMSATEDTDGGTRNGL